MMFTAQSPYDQPTDRIDVRRLQAWWAHQQNHVQVIDRTRWNHWPKGPKITSIAREDQLKIAQ